jgi:hypothetical protein
MSVLISILITFVVVILVLLSRQLAADRWSRQADRARRCGHHRHNLVAAIPCRLLRIADIVRRIEGYAIVSADGIIADANGEMPNSLRYDADQRFRQSGLDRAAVVIHGRHSPRRRPARGRR